MTKKIKKLEKETTQWRSKWESNNQALLQMAEEVTDCFHYPLKCTLVHLELVTFFSLQSRGALCQDGPNCLSGGINAAHVGSQHIIFENATPSFIAFI